MKIFLFSIIFVPFILNWHRVSSLILRDAEIKAEKPCNLRSFGEEKFVCVCNSTYCDELDEIQIPSRGLYKMWTSTKSGLRFLASQGQFENSDPTDVKGEIFVNRTNKSQLILGYGGAFTDSAGFNILSLSNETAKRLINSYFAPGGIHYTIGRVPIGGADFSLRGYTYDDIPWDVNFLNFSLQDEDLIFKIPLIKEALSVSPSPIRLFGSTWSSPPWTKTPSYDYKGQGWLKREYWEYWANYFVKFLDAYHENGLDFWAVTTQNEPSTGFIPYYPFNTLGWTAEWMVEWIGDYLGPILKRNYPNTNIIMFDDNSLFIKYWTDTMLSNEKSAQYIQGVGFHWYSNPITGYEPIRKASEKFPNVFFLSTEACTGFLPWELPKVNPGSWERGESYSQDILKGLESGAGGWVDWNLALDLKGGPNWAGLAADAAILVDATKDEFYKEPMYHALGHASKFFQPQAKVIECTVTPNINQSCSDCVLSQAVENPDGSLAVYILNKGLEDVDYIFRDSEEGTTILHLQKKSMTTIIYGSIDYSSTDKSNKQGRSTSWPLIEIIFVAISLYSFFS